MTQYLPSRPNLNSSLEELPYPAAHQRLASALLQTFEGAISGSIDAADAAMESIPVFGWLASMTGGVGAFLNNKVELLVLKLGIFGNDPTRTRLVRTGGRLSLLPMAGPYLGGAEDLVTLIRAWINVVAPDFVFSTLDPALNKAMDGLQAVKLSPALSDDAIPLAENQPAPYNVPGEGQIINARYTVVTPPMPQTINSSQRAVFNHPK
jgi:hypothetical protein